MSKETKKTTSKKSTGKKTSAKKVVKKQVEKYDKRMTFEYSPSSEAEYEEIKVLLERRGMTQQVFISNALELLKMGVLLDLNGTHGNDEPVKPVVETFLKACNESVKNESVTDQLVKAMDSHANKILSAFKRGISNQVDDKLSERLEALIEAERRVTVSALAGKDVNYNSAKRWLQKNHPEYLKK